MNSLGSDLEMETSGRKKSEAKQSIISLKNATTGLCKASMYIFQLIYLIGAVYLIYLSMYISNHMIFSLISDRVREKIFTPWCYTGLALMVISVTNLHYLIAIINSKRNNVLLQLMFTVANASILFGAL